MSVNKEVNKNNQTNSVGKVWETNTKPLMLGHVGLEKLSGGNVGRECLKCVKHLHICGLQLP